MLVFLDVLVVRDEQRRLMTIVYRKNTHTDIFLLKELGHHISDHDAINSTAILFLPYKEAISLDYCQFTGLWVQ